MEIAHRGILRHSRKGKFRKFFEGSKGPQPFRNPRHCVDIACNLGGAARAQTMIFLTNPEEGTRVLSRGQV